MKVRKVCKLPWPFILIVVYILCAWPMEHDKKGGAITGKVIGGPAPCPYLHMGALSLSPPPSLPPSLSLFHFFFLSP